MRRFSADYLTTTREGMWADSREALADLDLPGRERVLDVGCGTGELTRVLAEEVRDSATTPTVIGVDADPALLARAREHAPVVRGDARQLPFADDAVDLVACQALLVNMPDPVVAVREFARVSSDLVAAVEPDNGEVCVESTVPAERRLAARAREAYLDGVDTDVTLGGDGTREAFREAGLHDVRTRRYSHERTVEPPYREADLADVRRKATGAGIDSDRETMLAGDLGESEYAALRQDWREMGRAAAEQVSDGEYRRREVVPFYVTVGRV